MRRPLILPIATRPSALARAQTACVMRLLETEFPEVRCAEVFMDTLGDRNLDRPLPEIGGKGVFTRELEEAIRSGEVRAAVHSMKDLPVEDPPELTIGAVLAREEVRDVLVGRDRGMTIQTLPAGARIGTSSLRRSAQGLALRPDLVFESIRGNINTRLRKVSEAYYDAILLAGAGLIRLGLQDAISQWLPLELMLPAPGQGALAVQCRADDAEMLAMLDRINDPQTAAATSAERAFLNGLGSGCSLPVAAYAIVETDEVYLSVKVLASDGSQTIALAGRGKEPERLGMDMALQALNKGAAGLLSLPGWLNPI